MSEQAGPPSGQDDPGQGGQQPYGWDPPQGQPGQGSQPYGQYGYGQPPPYGGYQQPYAFPPVARDNGKATASLILGIAGLVVCWVICPIIALVLGYQARREIDESHGMQQGRGNAVAGIVLGWIGVGISVAFIILIVIVAITDDGSSDYDDYGHDGLRFAVRAVAGCARLVG